MFWAVTSGIGAFAVVLGVQLVIWRLVRVRREVLWLFALYLGLPGVAFAAIWLLSTIPAGQSIAAALVLFSLSAAFIQTYPALREIPPTLRILLLLEQHPDEGLSDVEIENGLQRDSLFVAKITDLVNDGFVVQKADGEVELTKSGRVLAETFRIYRKLLGRSDVAG